MTLPPLKSSIAFFAWTMPIKQLPKNVMMWNTDFFKMDQEFRDVYEGSWVETPRFLFLFKVYTHLYIIWKYYFIIFIVSPKAVNLVFIEITRSYSFFIAIRNI